MTQSSRKSARESSELGPDARCSEACLLRAGRFRAPGLPDAGGDQIKVETLRGAPEREFRLVARIVELAKAYCRYCGRVGEILELRPTARNPPQKNPIRGASGEATLPKNARRDL
jgi:hypothetical protein